MKRDILFNNNDLALVQEDGKYVVVKKKSKMKIIQRSLATDTRLLQTKETIATYLPKFNMVYKVFECPEIDGYLLIYTTDGDPLRYCCGKHELEGRYLEDFVEIATKEYKAKNYLYGELREAPESGYILMTKKKSFPNFVKDDFCSRMDINTDNPGVKFHYYRFTKEQEPEREIDMAICKKYKLKRDYLSGLYVFNYNVMGDWAFIELHGWKLIPGSAYSKRS